MMESIIPITSVTAPEGLPIKYILKKGLHVILYETTPSEFDINDYREINKRFYVITGLSKNSTTNNNKKYTYGYISMIHTQEAKPVSEIKEVKGLYKQGEVFRPKIVMSHTQFNALVEGRDFIITPLGEIKLTHEI